MAGSIFEWDQRVFDAAMREHVKTTRRSLPDYLNKKGYYVTRKAIWFTRKTEMSRIEATLGRMIRVKRLTKKGRVVNKRVWTHPRSMKFNAPLVAVILNARRGRKLEPGLYGRAMKAAIKRMIGARRKSVGFIKSGWIEARDILRRKFRGGTAGLPADDSGGRVGKPKGGALGATEGDAPQVVIWSSLETYRDTRGAIRRYGSAGLQRAFDDEAASMMRDLENHIKPEVEKFNAQAS